MKDNNKNNKANTPLMIFLEDACVSMGGGHAVALSRDDIEKIISEGIPCVLPDSNIWGNAYEPDCHDWWGVVYPVYVETGHESPIRCECAQELVSVISSQYTDQV